jgi:hypothetical protein
LRTLWNYADFFNGLPEDEQDPHFQLWVSGTII